MHLLDTSAAIALRDGVSDVEDRFAALASSFAISIITRIELEGGAAMPTPDGALRRTRLDELLSAFDTLPFDSRAADAYRVIVRQLGFSRRKTIDRMIAAQAIAAKASLITLNGDDFRDIPDLHVIEW